MKNKKIVQLKRNHLHLTGGFGASAAVIPQTILCEIERYYPVGTLLEAAASQKCWDITYKRATTAQLI